MSDQNKAWNFVLSNEDTVPPSGKVTPDGPGAVARLGINSKYWPEAVTEGFYEMPLSQALVYAEDLFVVHFWQPIDGDLLISQLIASKVADLQFNSDEGVLLLQRAANATWPAYAPLATDGICGALTVARVNMISGDQEEELYQAVIAQGATFYEELRAKYLAKFSAELEAEWIARLNRRPPS
jgi:lysozyme family protein